MRPLPAFSLLAFLVACSGSAQEPRAESPAKAEAPGQADGNASQGSSSSPADDETRPRPLSRADCAELIAHVVEVAVREDAAENPELPPPTDEAIAALESELRAELEDRCVGRDRGVYDCAMRAQTREALAACDDDAG